MGRRRNSSPASVLVGLLLIIFAIVKFFWWIVAAAVIVAAIKIVARVITNHTAAIAAATARRKEICARADQQHQWVMQGDPRGTYGCGIAAHAQYIQAQAPNWPASTMQPVTAVQHRAQNPFHILPANQNSNM